MPEPAISSVKVLILRYGIGPVEFPDFRGTGPQELQEKSPQARKAVMFPFKMGV